MVGGGLGRTHRSEDTFPALAQPLGFVDKDDILHTVKAIVAVQRDYGPRNDRKHGRMKYLVREWGIDKFRGKVEGHMRGPFKPFKPLPPWQAPDYLGWQQQGDGSLFFGAFISNGRIVGSTKDALRRIVDQYGVELRLTPHQNILLCNIKPAWQNDITTILEMGGFSVSEHIPPVIRSSMACPALPTCPLAIGEAERALPGVLERVQAAMQHAGIPAEQELVVRMTGCPNGCSRPYMAELGFVGDGPNTYQIWVGADRVQSRLAQPLMDRLHIRDFESKLLHPLLGAWWRDGSHLGFGDWCNGVGMERLKQIVAGA